MISSIQFKNIFIDSISNAFPHANFRFSRNGFIEGSFNHVVISINLENAYKEYQNDSTKIDSILKDYINAAKEHFEGLGKIDINKLVPLIRTSEYAIANPDEYWEKYNEDLVILYAEENGNSIRHLQKSDIKTRAIQKDQLREIAIKNLDSILTSIKRRSGDGVYMILAGGAYESSIILFDDFLTKENFPIEGDMVIAIPNRDLLLITGSENENGILKIKEVAANTFNQGSYKISNLLYKWNGKIFERFL